MDGITAFYVVLAIVGKFYLGPLLARHGYF